MRKSKPTSLDIEKPKKAIEKPMAFHHITTWNEFGDFFVDDSWHLVRFNVCGNRSKRDRIRYASLCILFQPDGR